MAMVKAKFKILFVVIVSLVFVCCEDNIPQQPSRRPRSKGVHNKDRNRRDDRERNLTEKDTIYLNRDEIVVPRTKELKPIIHDPSWPTPPEIVFDRPSPCYTRADLIRNFHLEGDIKELINACNYDSRKVRSNAAELVASSPGSFNLGQVCDLFDFCYQNWTYVNDPVTADYYASAQETLENGLIGDCDDFAILLCSAILAIGGEARISFAYGPQGGHAFTEVNLGFIGDRVNQFSNYLKARYNISQMYHKRDTDANYWLNLDWWASSPGGPYYQYTQGTVFNIIRNTQEKID